MASITTSIKFNNDTLQKIMTIIDDNKDTVNEGDYLKMCNAMKFLHVSYKNEECVRNAPQQHIVNTSDLISNEQQQYQRTIDDYRYRLYRNNYTLRANALPRKSQKRRHGALLRECTHFGIVIDDALNIPNQTSITLIENLLKSKGFTITRIEAAYLAYRRDERDTRCDTIRQDSAWLRDEIEHLEGLIYTLEANIETHSNR